MHKVAKPEQVVRAIGVYEWTGDLSKPKASRFVPVSVFIEGEYQDAGVYIARPVPFALQTGNIYELQDAGVPKGTVEMEYARHVQATDSSGDQLFNDGWIGYGPYHAPAPTRTTALRPSKTMPVITTSEGDSGKPHLTDKSSDSSAKASTDDPDRPTMKRRDSSGDSGSAGSSAGSQSGSTPADDPDRPSMKRRSGDDTTTTTSSGGSSGGGASSDDQADRPTLKRRTPEEMKKSQKDKDSASVMSAGHSLNDDPDRPNLRRTPEKTERELPELRGIPGDMHQMVAVSDAKMRDAHPFTRTWEDDTERTMVLEKMRALARAQLAAYKTPPGGTVMVASSSAAGSAAAPAKAAPSESVAAVTATAEQDPGAPTLKRGVPQQHKDAAATAPAPAAATQSAAKAKTATTSTAASRTKKPVKAAPVQMALVDEELHGYTLSYGGAPTFVYTAHTDGTGSGLRYVTIVAQDNGVKADGAGGLGELKLALASVTDEAHLDRTPRMRLIDVVDVEASNRASLLFELRATRSRQFALYRVIAAKPEQIFSTGTTE
jgi:hypothetical protein